MAISSQAERWGMLHIGMPWGNPPMPEATGGVSDSDRLHFLKLYPGIALAPPTEGVTEELGIGGNYSNTRTVTTDSTTSQELTVIGPTNFTLNGHAKQLNVGIRIYEGSTVALDQFTCEGQITPGGDWFVLKTTWGAAGDVTGFVLHSPDNLEGLVHGEKGVAILNPLGLYGIRFKSALASTPAEAVTRELSIGMIPD